MFIGRNIDGADICSILSKAGLTIQRHRDHFHPEEDDDTWIAAVAARGWAILTADKNIEKHHLDALVRTKAKLILLIGKRSGAIQWSSSVVVAMDGILQILADNEGPLVLRLGRNGEIKVRLATEVRDRQRGIDNRPRQTAPVAGSAPAAKHHAWQSSLRQSPPNPRRSTMGRSSTT